MDGPEGERAPSSSSSRPAASLQLWGNKWWDVRWATRRERKWLWSERMEREYMISSFAEIESNGDKKKCRKTSTTSAKKCTLKNSCPAVGSSLRSAL